MRHKRLISLSSVLLMLVLIQFDLTYTGCISNILDLPNRHRVANRIRCVQMLNEIDMKLKSAPHRHGVAAPIFKGLSKEEIIIKLSRFCADVEHANLISHNARCRSWLKYGNRYGAEVLIDPWGNVFFAYDGNNQAIVTDHPSVDGCKIENLYIWSAGPNGSNDWGENDDITIKGIRLSQTHR